LRAIRLTIDSGSDASYQKDAIVFTKEFDVVVVRVEGATEDKLHKLHHVWRDTTFTFSSLPVWLVSSQQISFLELRPLTGWHAR
jgi:hypothetical protein